MRAIINLTVVYICALSLSACMIDGTTSSNTIIPMSGAHDSLLYPESYENPVQYSLPNTSVNANEPVVLPEAFHLS